MSTQVLKVFVPRPVAMPRGALWAAQLVAALSHGGAMLWRAFEAQRRLRAERTEQPAPALSRAARIHPADARLDAPHGHGTPLTGASGDRHQGFEPDSTTTPNRYANLAAHAGPSPMGLWLSAALRRIGVRIAPKATPARDRVREAADVRAWAETQRRTDPRFAADLFAAADRHELEGN